MFLQSQPDPLAALTDERLRQALPKGAQKSWKEAGSLLATLRAQRLSWPPSQLLDAILKSKFREHIQRKYDNHDIRMADLEQLATYADNFGDVDRFLGEIALLTGLSGQEILVGADAPDEYVTLSSIHQSKGLEWSAVFGLWLSEGQFPSAHSETEAELEEERRLFYVMATRARDELYLCQPLVLQGRGGRQTILRESQFIEELRYTRAGARLAQDDLPFEEWQISVE